MPEPIVLKYRAFLSYGHADKRAAKWLHNRLENFRIDKNMIGRESTLGRVPTTLRPIFLDREDFTGGQTLSQATIASLDVSAALIVLCSTVAAGRPAVNEEVRLFKSRHPDRLVVPVIIEGTPPENFPPALRFELEADGTISDRAVTILAPDLRESGDGKNLALAKIVAALAGVSTDEIVRRAERDQRRRLRNWVGGLSVVIVALAGLTALAEINRRDAVEQRAIAEEQKRIADRRRQEAEENFTLAKNAAEGLVYDIASGLRHVEGMRAETVGTILQTAQKTFDALVDAAPDNLELRLGRSVMLRQFGETYRLQGSLGAALKSYESSRSIIDGLIRINPGDRNLQSDLGMVNARIGKVHLEQGNLTEALRFYEVAFAIADRLVKADPNNANWQSDLARSHAWIGDVHFELGHWPEALESFRAFMAIAEVVAKAKPDDLDNRRMLSAAHDRLGGALVKMGDMPNAVRAYEMSLAIIEPVVRLNPDDTQLQNDNSSAHTNIGDIQVRQGELRAAQAAYEKAFDIQAHLVKLDPGNGRWRRDLGVLYAKFGDIFLKQKRKTEALNAFGAGQAIFTELSQIDPDNIEWNRLLAASYGNTARAHVEDGNVGEARAGYRQARGIVSLLAVKLPGYKELSDDLSYYDARLKELK